MAEFVSQLNAVAAEWVDSLWPVLWQSTVVVVIVAALAALLLRRASPGVRYWVWQILALKLLLMPFWTYAVSLPWPAAPQPSETVASSPRPPPLEFEEPLASPAAPEETPAAVDDLPAAPKIPAIPLYRKVRWQAWLLVGWGFVVVLQLARLAVQRWRLGRLLKRARPADARLVSLVREAAGRLQLRRAPTPLLTEVGCSPFVCGVTRPVLVMPQTLAETLEPMPLQHVLLHELAHVKRLDLIWGWIPEIARIVYFFHPVVHWICYRLRLERELACDQLAMAHTGQDPAEYAATLVQVVSHASQPTVFKTAAASAGLDGNMASGGRQPPEQSRNN